MGWLRACLLALGCARGAHAQTLPYPPPSAPCIYNVPGRKDVTYDLTSLMDYNEDIVVSDASGSGAQFFIAVCKEPQRK